MNMPEIDISDRKLTVRRPKIDDVLVILDGVLIVTAVLITISPS